MEYYVFIERNEWEGETWRFYVPMLKEHRDMIASAIESTDEYDSPYGISKKPLEESEVIRRCNSGASGYMAYHNKCEPIKQELVDLLREGQVNILEDDLFYKGSCWK